MNWAQGIGDSSVFEGPAFSGVQGSKSCRFVLLPAVWPFLGFGAQVPNLWTLHSHGLLADMVLG